MPEAATRVMSGVTTRVGCAQLALAVGDGPGNAAQIRLAVNRAADAGAKVIVLPELANTGYVFDDRRELATLAEALDGPTVTEWLELARSLDVTIVGGIAERGDDGRFYNSAVMADPGGLRARYRKAHLWNTEKGLFTAGDERPPVVATSFGRIAIMICYDVEFSEWVRDVALRGADLLCLPVNWPLYPRPATERPAEIVRVQAAASSNRMFIAAADRTAEERGQDWLGGTVIVDADGFPTTALQLGRAGTVMADLPLADARRKAISVGNDVFTDRRPELYQAVVADGSQARPGTA